MKSIVQLGLAAICVCGLISSQAIAQELVPTNLSAGPAAPDQASTATKALPVPLLTPLPVSLAASPVPSNIVRTSTAPAVHEALAWDSMVKEYKAKKGETNAILTFSVTNISPTEVVIRGLLPSCGCTVAKMPSQPWRLAPGAGGQIQVNVDLRGKFGKLHKFISADTSVGLKLLRLTIVLPEQPVSNVALDTRGRNLMAALADRQAVFKGTCVKCHVEPGAGKMGRELYVADCAICHDTPGRASMVPDLRAKPHPNTRSYWKHWIDTGKAGTLMPAFAQEYGGPMSQAQVDSVIDYLMAPPQPATASSTQSSMAPPGNSSRSPSPAGVAPQFLPVPSPSPAQLQPATNAPPGLPPLPGS
ncbi:MAG: c-type cytochrome [Candidatus Omnitrophica bacterium]|nr:c-type cytochrome [Candidatus Omnitrophota bacterium]